MQNVSKMVVGVMVAAFCGAVMAGDLAIEKVWPQKLYCAPKSEQNVTTTVKNYDSKTKTAQLLIELRSGLDKKLTVFNEKISVPANSAIEVPVNFKADGEYMGWESVAILKEDDKIVSEKHEFFAVAPNPWSVANYNFFLWSYGLDISAKIASLRNDYSCIVEHFGFNSAYVGQYLPEKEEWISNCGYREKKSTIKSMIQEAHKNGIEVTAYVWNEDFGPAGFEFARKHPEWVRREKNGKWMADYNVELLDKLEADSFHYRMANEFDRPGSDKTPMWYTVKYDWQNIDLVKYLASEFVNTKKELGYDGFRFDCELSSAPCPDVYGNMPKNPLSMEDVAARNHDLVQEIVRKTYPNCLFGYNYAARQTSGSSEKLKAWYGRFKGNFILFEDTVCLWYPNHIYNNWEIYRKEVKEQGSFIVDQGGYYFIHLCRSGVIKTPMAYEYQAAIAFASRGHLSAAHEVAASAHAGGGMKRVNAFSLRFADQIFDPSLKDVADVAKKVSVSDNELWWKEYVYTHKFEGQEQWMIHLINPPLAAMSDPAMSKARDPRKNVVITLSHPEGKKIMRAWALSPDGGKGFITPLEAAQDKVVIPEVIIWSIICVDWR